MKHRIISIGKLIFTFLVLIFIFNFYDLNINRFAMLLNANIVYIFAGVIFFLANFGIQFLKFRLLLSTLQKNIPGKDIFMAMCVGYSLGFITPGNLGELGKGLYFKNISKTKSSSIVVMDKLINMAATISVGIVAVYILILAGIGKDSSFHNLIFIIGLISIGILTFLILKPSYVIMMLKKLNIARLEDYISKTEAALNQIRLNIKVITFSLGIIWIFVITLQYFFFISAFEVFPIKYSFLFIPAMLMIKILMPVTFGDLGIREGILIYFFKHISVSPEAVILGSLLVFLFNMVSPAVLGLFFIKKW